MIEAWTGRQERPSFVALPTIFKGIDTKVRYKTRLG